MFRSPLQLDAAEVLDWHKLLEALAFHASKGGGGALGVALILR